MKTRKQRHIQPIQKCSIVVSINGVRFSTNVSIVTSAFRYKHSHNFNMQSVKLALMALLLQLHFVGCLRQWLPVVMRV